jgi:hypothetical protein
MHVWVGSGILGKILHMFSLIFSLCIADFLFLCLKKYLKSPISKNLFFLLNLGHYWCKKIMPISNLKNTFKKYTGKKAERNVFYMDSFQDYFFQCMFSYIFLDININTGIFIIIIYVLGGQFNL